MNPRLVTLAVVGLMLTASLGCAHRTTTTYRTSETVREDTGRQQAAPPPPVEESTTVIKRSHTGTEEGQK